MPAIHYQSRGKGFPLVLIHGFCENHRIWDPFVKNFPANIHVITPDLPGFGKSPLPEADFTIDDIAGTLAEWINHLGLDRPVVVGHSLGGYITLALYRKYPSLSRGFGLLHSTAYADSEEKKANRLKVIGFVEKHGVEKYVETFIPGLFHQQDHPAIPLAIAIAMETPKQTFIQYAHAMRARTDSVQVLRSARVPILIVAGEEDKGIPVDSLRAQAKLNSRITLTVLPNTGHMGLFESEKAVSATISGFVYRGFQTG